MRVYSKSIEVFLKKLNLYAREILQNEFCVRVGRSRFHLANGWSYPIVIVALEHPCILGSFTPDDCSIGINRCLMFNAKTTVLKNILRHELAHYLLYTEHPETYHFLRPHGREYRELCQRYGLGEEVYSAKIDIVKENNHLQGDLKSEKIINKVQKLLSLAKSQNQYEAELATLKANQLITQYNLDEISLLSEKNDDIEYFTKLVLEGKRSTPRMSAISSILREFFVYPVKSYDGLEITGTLANIENAEYIAHFLDFELKKIWKKHKSQYSQIREKPFMVSLKHSYIAKLQKEKNKITGNDQKSLIALKKELSWAADGIYGGLTTCNTSHYSQCSTSSSLGHKAGNDLQINRGLSQSGITKLLSQ